MVFLKSPSEIEKMTASGRILGQVLETIGRVVEPGISTADLDQIARQMIKKTGGTPSFLGYGHPPFPAAICASIDDEIVHGIPSKKRRLQEGDIVSIDAGVYLDGYHADAARTFPVGSISSEKSTLLSTTRQCFWEAMVLARAGNRIGDLSAAIQKQAESLGYGVVRELTGHGIGRALHEEPDVPNFGRPGHGLRLEAGMALAIEPMINLGTRRVRMLNDGWTIVTADGKPSAHYENTLIITDGEPLILTLVPGERPHDAS
jgi:methionyl aminopeptidase